MCADITTTSNSVSQQPQWFQQALQQLVGGAQKTASQPYTTYTQPRIAGFTPAQNQAFGATQGAVGSYQPAFNAAGQDFSGGASGGGLDQKSFNSFMNPYTSDVVNQIQTLGNRNLTENVLPSVNATFTGAGQFGSTRNADFTNRALRDSQEAISQAQGQALNTGFQNQVGNSQAALGQQLQAGQLQQGLGQATQGAKLTDASALSAIGQQQQNQNQSNLNLGYQDFLTQQQWPYQQESYLSGILGGSPTATSTQQTNTTPGPSTTSQILGGLAGGVGLLGSTGAFGGSGWLTGLLGLAEGGPVIKRAKGGIAKARRPRFGGVASKRMGGIGLNPGGGVSGILPGAPAAAAQRLPGKMNPGTASVLRGLSGGASPVARMV